ncbi:PHP domain-containing protein [Rhodohalobacter sp. SW132]|uniref:TrlF family AAA-like ATPase n=1 Tax=Rhodohalobacter sp. SW132 TaxID=2293433 RepID=UPI000E21D550|nr:AAA family ATPase [Rhodohalobacter sp. SW132]REL38491.1 PHP domain-containing protein [Rhodohalobacter sp. SW132]
MANIQQELDEIGYGAKFRRGDLHIHSYGERYGSYDVIDTTMTPKAIVDKALEEGLEVISITDHNDIRNAEIAIDYANDKNILVIPGVEFSTTQGHLLVYFPTFKNLDDFFGKIDVSEDRKTCFKGFVECLELAGIYDGFGVAAHIDGPKGFETEIKNYNPDKENIIKHPNLLGLEIVKKDSSKFYTINDTEIERINFLKKRNKELSKEKGYPIAVVMNSDSHSLSRLGRNAADDKKITRFKMDTLTFESLKHAFLDSFSRIRIEEFVPENVPHFYGVRVKGGFLHNQLIKFSPNLTCIIGGRGAGKSTLLESIREASGNQSQSSKIVDSSVWPEEIELVFRDEVGEYHVFQRDIDEETYNKTDQEDGIKCVPIESYTQGRTADLIQHANDKPDVLLEFFDEFIVFEELKEEEEKVRVDLIDKIDLIDHLRNEVNKIEELKGQKKEVERKLEVQAKNKLDELIKLEQNLQKGREFRTDLIEDLNNAITTVRKVLSDKTYFNQIKEQDFDSIEVGKSELDEILNDVQKIEKIIEKAGLKIDSESKEMIKSIKGNLKSWRLEESKILSRIEEKKKELEEKGIRFDLAFIKSLTKQNVKIDKKLTQLRVKKKQYLKELKNERELIKERKQLKNRIYLYRKVWADKINQLLAETVTDYSISIKFNEGKFSEDLIQYLMTEINWYHTKTPKMRAIIETYPPYELLKILRSKDRKEFEKMESPEGGRLFSKTEVDSIVSLSKPHVLNRIKTIKFDDFPRLLVTKEERDESGKKVLRTKNFTNLSLGQQQSILLSILLYSDNKYPLLIDQPEDNLDSEFIYKTIVKNLRRVKEIRQVIIVTHNANIAVLGDAELIIPFKSTSQRAHLIDSGSIDNTETKNITCNILEGSKQAFKKRKEIYGI